MPKTYLQGVKNKCRCGEPAEGIKEETVNAKGKVTKVRIVASNCKKCGLRYVADDMRGDLTPAFQKTINQLSL